MERELKRIKLETDASEVSRCSPASAIALILRSVTQLDQLLAANINPATSALQAATTDTAKAIVSVEGVVGQGRANASQDDARSLEGAGQRLWNRSQSISKLRSTNEDKESTTEAKKLVAKIQHLALRLLRIALNSGSTIEGECHTSASPLWLDTLKAVRKSLVAVKNLKVAYVYTAPDIYFGGKLVSVDYRNSKLKLETGVNHYTVTRNMAEVALISDNEYNRLVEVERNQWWPVYHASNAQGQAKADEAHLASRNGRW